MTLSRELNAATADDVELILASLRELKLNEFDSNPTTDELRHTAAARAALGVAADALRSARWNLERRGYNWAYDCNACRDAGDGIVAAEEEKNSERA